MNYTKGLCFDKLDLIKGMIEHNLLNQDEINYIWHELNDVSHVIDEYIDRRQIRDRRNTQKKDGTY